MLITEVKQNISKVVVIIFMKPNESFLISSRPKGKSFPGYWEFPGGKVEKNETLFEAIIRESKEEVSVIPSKNNLFFFDQHFLVEGEKKTVVNLFKCTSWIGHFVPREGQVIKWIFKKDIEKFKFLDLNYNFFKKI